MAEELDFGRVRNTKGNIFTFSQWSELEDLADRGLIDIHSEVQLPKTPNWVALYRVPKFAQFIQKVAANDGIQPPQPIQVVFEPKPQQAVRQARPSNPNIQPLPATVEPPPRPPSARMVAPKPHASAPTPAHPAAIATHPVLKPASKTQPKVAAPATPPPEPIPPAPESAGAKAAKSLPRARPTQTRLAPGRRPHPGPAARTAIAHSVTKPRSGAAPIPQASPVAPTQTPSKPTARAEPTPAAPQVEPEPDDLLPVPENLVEESLSAPPAPPAPRTTAAPAPKSIPQDESQRPAVLPAAVPQKIARRTERLFRKKPPDQGGETHGPHTPGAGTPAHKTTASTAPPRARGGAESAPGLGQARTGTAALPLPSRQRLYADDDLFAPERAQAEALLPTLAMGASLLPGLGQALNLDLQKAYLFAGLALASLVTTIFKPGLGLPCLALVVWLAMGQAHGKASGRGFFSGVGATTLWLARSWSRLLALAFWILAATYTLDAALCWLGSGTPIATTVQFGEAVGAARNWSPALTALAMFGAAALLFAAQTLGRKFLWARQEEAPLAWTLRCLLAGVAGAGLLAALCRLFELETAKAVAGHGLNIPLGILHNLLALPKTLGSALGQSWPDLTPGWFGKFLATFLTLSKATAESFAGHLRAYPWILLGGLAALLPLLYRSLADRVLTWPGGEAWFLAWQSALAERTEILREEWKLFREARAAAWESKRKQRTEEARLALLERDKRVSELEALVAQLRQPGAAAPTPPGTAPTGLPAVAWPAQTAQPPLPAVTLPAQPAPIPSAPGPSQPAQRPKPAQPAQPASVGQALPEASRPQAPVSAAPSAPLTPPSQQEQDLPEASRAVRPTPRAELLAPRPTATEHPRHDQEATPQPTPASPATEASTHTPAGPPQQLPVTAAPSPEQPAPSHPAPEVLAPAPASAGQQPASTAAPQPLPAASMAAAPPDAAVPGAAQVYPGTWKGRLQRLGALLRPALGKVLAFLAATVWPALRKAAAFVARTAKPALLKASSFVWAMTRQGSAKAYAFSKEKLYPALRSGSQRAVAAGRELSRKGLERLKALKDKRARTAAQSPAPAEAKPVALSSPKAATGGVGSAGSGVAAAAPVVTASEAKTQAPEAATDLVEELAEVAEVVEEVEEEPQAPADGAEAEEEESQTAAEADAEEGPAQEEEAAPDEAEGESSDAEVLEEPAAPEESGAEDESLDPMSPGPPSAEDVVVLSSETEVIPEAGAGEAEAEELRREDDRDAVTQEKEEAVAEVDAVEELDEVEELEEVEEIEEVEEEKGGAAAKGKGSLRGK